MYVLFKQYKQPYNDIQEYLDCRGYCCHEKYCNNRIRDNQDK